jgi:hypothetical protein
MHRQDRVACSLCSLVHNLTSLLCSLHSLLCRFYSLWLFEGGWLKCEYGRLVSHCGLGCLFNRAGFYLHAWCNYRLTASRLERNIMGGVCCTCISAGCLIAWLNLESWEWKVLWWWWMLGSFSAQGCLVEMVYIGSKWSLFPQVGWKLQARMK